MQDPFISSKNRVLIDDRQFILICKKKYINIHCSSMLWFPSKAAKHSSFPRNLIKAPGSGLNRRIIKYISTKVQFAGGYVEEQEQLPLSQRLQFAAGSLVHCKWDRPKGTVPKRSPINHLSTASFCERKPNYCVMITRHEIPIQLHPPLREREHEWQRETWGLVWDSAELSCNVLFSASFHLNLNKRFLDLCSCLLQSSILDQQSSKTLRDCTVLWRKPAERLQQNYSNVCCLLCCFLRL